MTILTILTFPHPILRQKAEQVTRFDDKLQQLAANMRETMYKAPGVGLAANQIGILQQLIVIDIAREEEEKKYFVLVNPVISDEAGCDVDEEGCLSVLEYTAKVKRFTQIHVTAMDLDGKTFEFDAEGRFARIIQHEIDHLYGKLFIDRISSLKRNLYKKKLKKILRSEAA